MKILQSVALVALLTGCASTADYQSYVEQSSRIQQAINASEAACFLVLAEAMKTADSSAQTAISTQIEKCKKEPPKIEPPTKNWLGL